jgi:hypothetical protein
MSPLRALTAIRAVIGSLAWLAPRLTARLFGISAAANPQLPYVARLFAIRDLALGVGLQSSEGDARRVWVQIGIACDAADAAAGLLARRRGELSTLSTVLVTATALNGVALGSAALRGIDADAAHAPA